MRPTRETTYDERDGVDIVDDIVGYAVQLEASVSNASGQITGQTCLHRRGLRSQVTGHLVVRDPVDGVEQETVHNSQLAMHFRCFTLECSHFASRDGSLELINPGVIPSHPSGLFAVDMRRLDSIPCEKSFRNTSYHREEVPTVSRSEKLLGVEG